MALRLKLEQREFSGRLPWQLWEASATGSLSPQGGVVKFQGKSFTDARSNPLNSRLVMSAVWLAIYSAWTKPIYGAECVYPCHLFIYRGPLAEVNSDYLLLGLSEDLSVR